MEDDDDAMELLGTFIFTVQMCFVHCRTAASLSGFEFEGLLFSGGSSWGSGFHPQS